MGQGFFSLGDRVAVIRLIDVAGLHIIPMVRSDACLEIKERPSLLLGIGIAFRVAGSGKEPADHLAVCLTDGFKIILTVVRFIRKPKAALANSEYIGLRVLGISVNKAAERHRPAGNVKDCQCAGKVFLSLRSIDQAKVFPDRVQARFFTCFLIKIGVVQGSRFG